MNSTHPDFGKIEENLERLRRRMPDMPISGVLLSRLLLHLGRGMAAMMEHQIRPSGLAEAEFRVLSTLFSQPDGVAHPSDLCARTSQSPANMSRISDALVSRNLITRVLSVQDRRKMVLQITAEGEELVQRLLPVMFAPLREMCREFSEDEQRQLIAQLKRLGANLTVVMSQEFPERTP
jgi:MarR family transcriptional repressor of emrRAB